MPLEIRESYVNLTEGVRYGDTEWYAPYDEDRGALFRHLRAEYGRCVSRMYVDRKVSVVSDPTSPAFAYEVVPVGWVFQKRCEYDDAHRFSDAIDRTFLREVWIEVREAQGDNRDDQD